MEDNQSALKLGLNYCSNSEYHGDRTALSSTVVKTVYKDLAQYHREYILGVKPEKPYNASMGMGTLMHSLILEPELVSSEYNFVQAWDRRAKEYKNIVAALPASDKRSIVTQTEKAKADRMMAACKAHPTYMSYFTGGQAEVTLVAVYNIDTGAVTFDEADEGPNTVRIKVRLDYLQAELGRVNDVKTTGFASDLTTFKGTCEHWMYQLSGALYLMVAEAWFKRTFQFYFGVVSTTEFTCEVFRLSDKKRLEGVNQIRKAMLKLKQARETGVWAETNSPAARAEVQNYEVLEV